MKITKAPKRLAEPMREVKQLVQRITEADDDELPDILLGISEWCWPRGDLHYWIHILNRFDLILEETCRDYDLHKLQINEFTPLRKRIILSILKFTRLLIENCTSRKLYASYEHLNNLLFARDIDILEATLRVVLRFSQQHSSQHPRAELTTSQEKLATLAVTWAPRDHGFSMVDVAREDAVIPADLQHVKFQFYRRREAQSSFAFATADERAEGVSASTEGGASAPFSTPVRPPRARERVQSANMTAGGSTSATPAEPHSLPGASSEQHLEGMTTIELGQPSELGRNAMDVLADAIDRYSIPPEDHFELYQKIRLAMAMPDLAQRRKLLQCRLLAIAAYAHIVPESVASTQLFLYEPEVISHLAALVNPQNELPDYIVSGSLYAMDALGRYRSKLHETLNALNASVNHGILLQTLRKIIDDLSTGAPTQCDEYVDAYFGLVSFITSTNTGSGLVVGAGLLQLLIKLVDTAKPESYMVQRSVTRAIGLLDSVIYAYVPAFNLFCQTNGLVIFVRRIEEEITYDVELAESSMDDNEDAGPDNLFGKLTFGRAHLLRGFLQSISHMMVSTGTADGLRNLIDSSLVASIKLIMEHRRVVGPQNLALAISIMATFVHNEPTSLGIIQEKKLPETFLATIKSDIEAHFDVINAIPNAIGALCLNQAGLDMFSNATLTDRLLSLLTSERHSKVLQDQDNVTVFGSSMDELIRHQPTLKQSVRSGIFKVLESIQKAGKAFEANAETVTGDKVPLYSLAKTTDRGEGSPSAESGHAADSAADSAATRGMALADVIMDEADVFVRNKDDALKEPNAVASYMDVTARFLEVFFQSPNHCSDFLRADGLEKLLAFYNLPCLPYNFATSVAADSMVHLLRYIAEINPNTVITALLREVKTSLEETKSLWNETDEDSTLCKLLRPRTDEDLSSVNGKFRQLVKLNARMQLLSDVIPTFTYSGSKTSATVLLQVLNTTPSIMAGNRDVATLSELGDFMRAWTWETVLFKSATHSTTHALRQHEQRQQEKELAEAAASSDQAEKKDEGVEETFNASSSLVQNTVALRYITSQVKLALHAFFVETNKIFVARRSHDSSHKRFSSLTATQIGNILEKNMVWRSHTKLHLSCDYMIVMITQATKLLYEERSGQGVHAQTKVLLTFIKQGGLKQVLNNYQRFSEELDRYYEAEGAIERENSQPSGIDDILHACGGLQMAAELLLKMVSHSPLLDSPSTSIIKASSKDGTSESFEPRAFLITMRLAIAPVVRQTWQKEWLTTANPSIVGTVVRIILKLAEGEGEAAAVAPARPEAGGASTSLTTGSGSITAQNGVGRSSAALMGLAQALGAPIGDLTSGMRQRSMPTADEARVRQLTDMGFPRRAARHALIRCANNLSAATEYLLMHPEIVNSMQGGDSSSGADGVPAADPATSTTDGEAQASSDNPTSSDALPSGSETAAANDGSNAPREGVEANDGAGSEAAAAAAPPTADNAASADTPMAEPTAEEETAEKKKGREEESALREKWTQEAAQLESERAAICESLLRRSLELNDKFDWLVYDTRVAVRIVTQSYAKVQPLEELIDGVRAVAGEARGDKMKFVTVRLHLLALIFHDSPANPLQCSRAQARAFFRSLVSLIETEAEEKVTPTWIASFFLTLSALLSAEDAIPEGKMADKEDRSAVEVPRMWEDGSAEEDLSKLLSFSLTQLNQASSLSRDNVLALYRFVVTLTRRPVLAQEFVERDGLTLIMKPFSGKQIKDVAVCRPYAVLILRHIIESHAELLQLTITQEVRSFFCQSRLKVMDTSSVTKSLGPVILREPDVFLDVAKGNLELVDYKPAQNQGILKLAESGQRDADADAPPTDAGGHSNESHTRSAPGFIAPLERGADDSMDLVPLSPTKPGASAAVDEQLLELGSKGGGKEPSLTSSADLGRLETVVHFLLSELLRVTKDRSILAGKEVAEEKSEAASAAEGQSPAETSFFYACFLLQSLTELLSSYKACKVSFLSFSRKRSTASGSMAFGTNNKRDSAHKPKSSGSILAFFLSELVPLGFLQSREPSEMRRLMTISSWAMSAIVALCADVVVITPDVKEVGQEVIFARKSVLDGVAKAIKEATTAGMASSGRTHGSSESIEARYGRLYSLSDLCYRLLKARPNSTGSSSGLSSLRSLDDLTLHMAKTMLERNFVTVLTSALADVDLNLPMVKSLLDRILKPLEYLTKIAIKMHKAERKNDKRKLNGVGAGAEGEHGLDGEDLHSLMDEDEEDEDEADDGEGEGEEQEAREETPDFYRNSSLGMHTGELENAVHYDGEEDDEDDEDEEEDDEDMDEEMEGVIYSDGETEDSDSDDDDIDEEHIIEVMEEDDEEDSSDSDDDDDDDDDEEDVDDEAGSWIDDDDEEDQDEEGESEALDFYIEGDADDAQRLFEQATGFPYNAEGQEGEEGADGPPATITYDIQEIEGEDDEEEEDEEEMDEDEESVLEGMFEHGDLSAMAVPASHDQAPMDRFGNTWSWVGNTGRNPRDQTDAGGQQGNSISPFAFLGQRPQASRPRSRRMDWDEVLDSMRRDQFVQDGRSWPELSRARAGGASQDVASHPLLVEDPSSNDASAFGRAGGRQQHSSRRAGGYADWAQSLQGLMGGGAMQFLETMIQRSVVSQGGHAEPLQISVGSAGLPRITSHVHQGRHRDLAPVTSRSSPAAPAAATAAAAETESSDTVLAVQDFSPMSTMSRWSEDMRVIAGGQADGRLRTMRSHLVNTLRPTFLIAQDALKKKREEQEEERKKAKEADAAAKAKAKDEEEQAKQKKQEEAGAADQGDQAAQATQTGTGTAAVTTTPNIASETATQEGEGAAVQQSQILEPLISDADTEMGEPRTEGDIATASLPANLELNSLQQGLAELDSSGRAAAQQAPEESVSSATPAPPAGDGAAVSAAAAPTQRITTRLNGNEIDITDSGIDPTFLEALPEDMREEVLNQHFRERRAAEAAAALGGGRGAATSNIAPEFLEALPPEIRAEVIQQEAVENQRRRREERRGEEQSTGPSDMDNASFLASLNPDLRGAVLLEQDSAFLDSMPASIRQEVEALRRDTQQARDSRRRRIYGVLGGGGGADGNASLPGLNAALTRRGNGEAAGGSNGATAANATEAAKKADAPRDAIQLLDKAGIAALVRLLFFPQMDSNSSGLREVLVNLSENSKSRFELLNLLLMILAEGASSESNAVDKSYNNVSVRINKVAATQTPTRPAPPRRGTSTTAVVTTPATPAASSAAPATSSLIAPLSRAGDEAPFLIASRSIETLIHLTSANEQAAQYFLKDDASNIALMKWFKKSGQVKGKEREKVTSNAPINILLVLLAKPSILANAQLVDSLMTLLHTVTRPLPLIVTNRRKAEEEEKEKEKEKETEASSGDKDKDGAEKPSLETKNNLPPSAPHISEDRMAAVVKPLSISISSKGFQNTLAVASNLSTMDGALDVITSALQREATTAGKALMSELDDLLDSLPAVDEAAAAREEEEQQQEQAARETDGEAGTSAIERAPPVTMESDLRQPTSSPALTKLASPSSSQTIILRSLRALEWVLTRPKTSSQPSGLVASASANPQHHRQHHHHHHHTHHMNIIDPTVDYI